MSSTWHEVAKKWIRRNLAGVSELTETEVRLVESLDVDTLSRKVLLYPRLDVDGRAICLLLAPPGARVTVNGERLTTGARVLADRDVIGRAGSSDVYFSTEKLACVEPFSSIDGGGRSGDATYCARCRSAIEPGFPAVRCPACSTWFHQNPAESRDCWTYGPRCAVCQQETDLENARYKFTPETL